MWNLTFSRWSLQNHPSPWTAGHQCFPQVCDETANIRKLWANFSSAYWVIKMFNISFSLFSFSEWLFKQRSFWRWFDSIFDICTVFFCSHYFQDVKFTICLARKCHYDRIHSSFTAVHRFDDGYVGKQSVAWKEYCAEYWLKELQENKGWCTGRRDITEILLENALTLYQTTEFWTCPNWKHLQTTN